MVQQQSVMFLTAAKSVAWANRSACTTRCGRRAGIRGGLVSFSTARVAEICTLDARTFLSEPSSGSSTAPESLSPLLLLGWPLEALREMDCCVGVLNFGMGVLSSVCAFTCNGRDKLLHCRSTLAKVRG